MIFVIRSRKHEHGESRADRCANTIKKGLARTFLHPKELIEFMHLHPDLLFWLQRHYNELTVPSGVKHLAKIFILDCNTFDVLYITFHSSSSS